jgi:hypothetical protein
MSGLERGMGQTALSNRRMAALSLLYAIRRLPPRTSP